VERDHEVSVLVPAGVLHGHSEVLEGEGGPDGHPFHRDGDVRVTVLLSKDVPHGPDEAGPAAERERELSRGLNAMGARDAMAGTRTRMAAMRVFQRGSSYPMEAERRQDWKRWEAEGKVWMRQVHPTHREQESREGEYEDEEPIEIPAGRPLHLVLPGYVELGLPSDLGSLG